MGENFGGSTRFTDEEVESKLKLISHIDLMKFGWVDKVSTILKISHTQVKRFIKKYYKDKYYQRNAVVNPPPDTRLKG